METFKHLMGFTLLGAAVWLFGAFQAQVSADAANWFLAFLLVLAVAVWAMERFATLRHSSFRRYATRLVIVAGAAAAGVAMVRFDPPPRPAATVAAGFDDAPVATDHAIQWRAFDPETIVRETSRQRPVFVDYTADWCAACKTNEKLFLETADVRQALRDTGILPMKADMTNEDAKMEEWLGRLELDGKKLSGIPAYAIYLPDQSVEVLPTVITTDLVVSRLRRVADRFPKLVVAN
jgi:thiol:disulfide interchange protein DsbD